MINYKKYIDLVVMIRNIEINLRARLKVLIN
jgi:hypothetical protein